MAPADGLFQQPQPHVITHILLSESILEFFDFWKSVKALRSYGILNYSSSEPQVAKSRRRTTSTRTGCAPMRALGGFKSPYLRENETDFRKLGRIWLLLMCRIP